MQSLPLPALRDDLRIEAGAATLNGAPSWVVYDPLRHRYFQIGQRMIQILRAWQAGGTAEPTMADTLKKRIEAAAGWAPSDEEITATVQFLVSSELTKTPMQGGSRVYHGAAEKAAKMGPLKLARSYLFFRIPLVQPQKFLNATEGLARVLLSRGMVAVLALIGALGLWMVSRQWDGFVSYAQQFVSLEGAAYYAIALIFIKILHELGHAWQAHLRGVRVPIMGVAFMVMFPLLYTDVSDAWRCRRRKDRLMIDAGGVMMELGIAAVATLLWMFLPDGPLRSVVFAAATTSWVLSLAVNLNPFMRFDGYYFLSDAVGVQNLQPRGFAMTRWWLRETLFGLNDPAPERFTTSMRRFLIGYSLVTWVYRFFLYIGIALLVYTLFFKALGLFLLIVELAFFIALPVLKEMKVWYDMRHRLITRPRFWLSAAVLAVAAALLVYPFQGTVRIPATLEPSREAGLYAPVPARVAEVFVTEGQIVQAGEQIALLASADLMMELDAARKSAALAQLKYDRRGAQSEERARSLVLEQELDAAQARVAGLEKELEQLRVQAPFDGKIVDLDRGAKAGVWLSDQRRIATLISADELKISGYISEDDVSRIEVDATARFIPEDPAIPAVDATIVNISNFTARSLGRGYLSATNGGSVPVEQNTQSQTEVPYGAWFFLRSDVASSLEGVYLIDTPLRGVLITVGRAESMLNRAFRQVARVLMREFGV